MRQTRPLTDQERAPGAGAASWCGSKVGMQTSAAEPSGGPLPPASPHPSRRPRGKLPPVLRPAPRQDHTAGAASKAVAPELVILMVWGMAELMWADIGIVRAIGNWLSREPLIHAVCVHHGHFVTASGCIWSLLLCSTSSDQVLVYDESFDAYFH